MTVLDDAGTLRTCATPRAASRIGQPASQIVLDETIAALVDELRAAAPPGSTRDEVSASWRRVIARAHPRRSLRPLLSSLLPDLVVLDPADPALKASWPRPVARAPGALADLAPGRGGGRALLAAGYHQQVPVRPGSSTCSSHGGRAAGDGWDDGTVEVRGLGRGMPRGGSGALARERTPRGARGAAPAAGPGRSAAHRGLRRRPRGDRLPRADRPVLRPLRDPAAGARPAPQRHPGGAGAGAGPGGGGPALAELQADPEALWPAGRASPTRRWTPLSPARARPWSGAGARSRRRGRPGPDARAAADAARGARCTRSKRCRRRPCVRSRSGTRPGRSGCAAPGTPSFPAARFQERGLGARRACWRAPRPAVVEEIAQAHGPWGPGPPGDPRYEHRNHLLPTVGGSGAVAAELGKQLARRGHASTSSPTACPSAWASSRRTSASTRSTSPPTRSSSTRPTTWPWPPRWPRWPASTPSTSSTCTTRSPTPSPGSWPSRCWGTSRRS